MAGDLLGSLVVKISADMAELKTGMDRAAYVSEQAFKKIESAGKVMESALKGVVAGLAAGLSAGMFVDMIKGSIDAADHLNDLSKSTGIAVEQLAGLRLAAKQSGGDLDGIAAAVNKLSVGIGKGGEKFAALGVSAKDPLEAFKQLSDVFSAIDDPQLRAALGAEAIGKAWASAAPLLAEGGKKIGEMVADGERLSGVTKAITDSADEFNDKLAKLTGTGGGMTRMVGSILPLMNQLAGSMVDLQRESAGADSGFHPLLETMRALVILGGNVGFVFKAVGTEIGGLAAQLATIARAKAAFDAGDVAGITGSLREFTVIGKAMTEDAEARRTAFDQWQAGIMKVGTAAEEAAKKIDSMDQVSRRMIQTDQAAARAASEAATAKAKAFIEYEERMKAAAEAYKKWLAEEERLRKLDAKGWVEYVDALEKADIDALKEIEKQWDAHWKLMEQMRVADLKGSLDFIEAIADANDALLTSMASLAPSMSQLYTAVRDAVAQSLTEIEKETKLIGLGNTERAKAIALMERDLELKKTEVAIHPELVAKVNELYEARVRFLDLKDAQASLSQMTSSLTDAILNAFEAGKGGAQQFLAWLKAEFAKTVLRPQIQSAVNSVFGVSTAGGATAGGDIFGGITSAIGSFFTSSGAGGGFGMNDRSLGDNSMAGLFERYLGTSAPLLAGIAQVATGVTIGLGVGGALAKAIGGDDVHPLHSIIGTVVGGIIGAIYGGYAGAALGSAIGGVAGGIIDGAMNEGPAERSARIGSGAGDYTYSSSSRFGDIGIQRFTDKWFSDADMSGTLNAWFRTIGKLDTEVAKHFSGDEISRATAALAGRSTEYGFGTEHNALDPELLSGIVKDRFAVIFGVIDSQMADLVKSFKGSGEDLITLIVDLSTVHERLTSLGPSLSTLFGENISFGALSDLKGETEGYTEALQRLAAEYGVTNQIADMLGKTQAEVWGSIGFASEGARAHLIALAGGLDKLSSQLDFYYTHFYTTAEQQAHTLADLSQSFTDLGFVMPTTVDGFRMITDHFLGMGEAGAQASATLLQLAPAFYAYIQAIEAVDTALAKNQLGFRAIFGQSTGVSTDDIRALQQNGEVLTATLTRLTAEFNATNSLLVMFGLTSEEVFGAFGLASEAARAKLIELSGGLDAFTANLSGFYQNYFTEAERNQRAVTSLMDTFASLGLEMPKTTAGFRELLERQLALGPAGAAAVAALLGIQQTFFDMFRNGGTGERGPAPIINVGRELDETAIAARKAHEALVELNETLTNSFRDAYRSIELAGRSNEEQYRYLQKEAATYVLNLQSASTGEEVQTWAEKIKSDMLAAFNLLSPEEQDNRRQEFLDNLLKVSELVTAQLTAIDPTGNLGTSGAAVRPAEAAATAQANAATAQQEAAAMQKAAAADFMEGVAAFALAQTIVKRFALDLPGVGTVEAGA